MYGCRASLEEKVNHKLSESTSIMPTLSDIDFIAWYLRPLEIVPPFEDVRDDRTFEMGVPPNSLMISVRDATSWVEDDWWGVWVKVERNAFLGRIGLELPRVMGVNGGVVGSGRQGGG